MKKMLAVAVIAFSFLFAGCAMTLPVHSGGTIGKTADREKVHASVSAINFLALTPMSFEKNEEALKLLQAKCSGGEVTAVTSMVRFTWLIIAQHEKLSVSGYCV